MRIFAILCLSVAVSCSRAQQSVEARRNASPSHASEAKAASVTRMSAEALGEPYGLRFEGNSLFFCDGHGARKIDLQSGQVSAAVVGCRKFEANTACSGFAIDVSVRAQRSEPNDIIDVDGSSFPLTGRVHDCIAEGKTIAIATNSQVVAIDVARDAMMAVNAQGGDRVALNSQFIGWTDGAKVWAVSRSGLQPKLK